MASKFSTCKGKRSGATCGSALFKCGHCGECGCQRGECDNQQFLQGDQCKDCGRAWEMQRQLEPSAEAKPQEENKRKRRSGGGDDWIKWLAGAAAILVLVAGAGMLLRFNPSQVGDGAQPRVPVINAVASPPSETAIIDVCGCYDEGFKLNGAGYDVLSPEYRTGFLMCRKASGADGGDAWTAGWNARKIAKPYEASCRSYRRRG